VLKAGVLGAAGCAVVQGVDKGEVAGAVAGIAGSTIVGNCTRCACATAPPHTDVAMSAARNNHPVALRMAFKLGTECKDGVRPGGGKI
jgi:hypothetical protein